jgi:hypothetical protein
MASLPDNECTLGIMRRPMSTLGSRPRCQMSPIGGAGRAAWQEHLRQSGEQTPPLGPGLIGSRHRRNGKATEGERSATGRQFSKNANQWQRDEQTRNRTERQRKGNATNAMTTQRRRNGNTTTTQEERNVAESNSTRTQRNTDRNGTQRQQKGAREKIATGNGTLRSHCVSCCVSRCAPDAFRW